MWAEYGGTTVAAADCNRSAYDFVILREPRYSWEPVFTTGIDFSLTDGWGCRRLCISLLPVPEKSLFFPTKLARYEIFAKGLE